MQWCNSISCLEPHNYQLLCLVMHYFQVYQDIILAIMFQTQTMYKRYKLAGSREKVISLLGKKNTGKKTPKDDSELGYSDFTLTVTIHLPQPQQKSMQLSPMHKNLNTRVVGEENLWRKAPSISKMVGPVPRNPRPLQSKHPQWCPQQQLHHQ